MPLLSLKKVSKKYDDTKVLEDFSLDFDEGKFYCLLGSSGNGKTTILRLIAGLEKPNSGKIFIKDNLVSQDSTILISSSQHNLGFIFQNLALWPHLTVFENIAHASQ